MSLNCEQIQNRLQNFLQMLHTKKLHSTTSSINYKYNSLGGKSCVGQIHLLPASSEKENLSGSYIFK